MKRLVIIGANGHGKVIKEIGEFYYKNIVFLDDVLIKNVSGPVSDFIKYKNDSDFIVAIGNNEIRAKIFSLLGDVNHATLIHPNAYISKTAKIGKRTVVMAGAVINADVTIGKGVIINTCSSIDHDCIINDFSHISVGSHIAGTVEIGSNGFVCAGATVINNLKVCSNVIIGAGGTGINNIEESGTYVGTPTKKI